MVGAFIDLELGEHAERCCIVQPVFLDSGDCLAEEQPVSLRLIRIASHRAQSGTHASSLVVVLYLAWRYSRKLASTGCELSARQMMESG